MRKLLPILAWIWIAAGLLWYYYLAGRDPGFMLSADWICTVIFLAAKRILLPYGIALFIFYAGHIVGVSCFYNDEKVEIGLLDIAKSTGLGLGIISLATFLIGLINIWLALVVVAVGVYVFWDLRPERIKYNIPMHPMYLAVLVLVLLQAHYPLVPVVAWDALNSHLEAPRVFLENDRIAFHHYINFNNFPMLIEMLYFVPLLLRCPEATQVMGYLFFVLTLCAILGWDWMYGKYTAVIACVLFFTMPRFVQFSAVAMTDVPLMFYTFMAVMSFLDRGSDDFQTGMWWGFALSVKYFAVIPLFWMVCYGLYRKRLGSLLYIFGVALVLISPYYLRNIILFGNPIFPFADGIFGWFPGVYSSAGLTVDGIAMLDKFRYPQSIASLWTWVFDLTTVARWGTMFTQFGAAIFIGLPFVVFRFAQGLGNRTVIAMGLISLGFIYTQIFVMGILQGRYMFTVLPFICILLGWGVGHIRWRWWMAVLCMLIVSMWLYHVQQIHVWHIALTEEHRYWIRDAGISGYRATVELNNNATRDEVVYAYFAENNRFYSIPKMIGGLYGWADHKEFARYCTSGFALWTWLKQYDVDWLLVDRLRLGEACSVYPEMALPEPMEPWFKKVMESEKSFIYRLEVPWNDEELDNNAPRGCRALAGLFS